MGRYGTKTDSLYPKKLPTILELASKTAKFMGASDGVWNPAYLFDRSPNSELNLFTGLNVTFTPDGQRNKDWANGLNYPISFSRSKTFFPALKTAYDNDTSVLTNFFTAMACVQLEKVGLQVWREFSGVISLTPGQLVKEVNQSVIDKTTGVFAGLFNIVPNAAVTSFDEQLGYAWHLPISIYANVSKTVMTLSVQAYRMASTASSN